MPLPVGYQCSSTKNSFDYAVLIDADIEYPMWRAIFVRPNGLATNSDVEFIDAFGVSRVFTVKRAGILHVRDIMYSSNLTTARDVIALY